MAINWNSIKAISDDTPQRLVSLSPLSKTLIDAAFSYLSPMYNYEGEGYEKTSEEVDEIKSAVDTLMLEVERQMLIGLIMPYVGLTVPVGTLRCDGSIYQRTDYPELYEYAIGTALIIDADSFNVPLFTGRTIVAAGSGFPHGSAFGEAAHVLTIGEMPSHSHTYTPAVLNVDLESPGAPDFFGAGVGVPTLTSAEGGGAAHNNYQPSLALYYAIVAGR